jgi:DNA polymerase-3 subunit delta'
VPFRDVLTVHGQRRVVELLARSAARASLPPSLIFAGPAGSGKHATAVALAQLLNCPQPRREAAATADSQSPLALDACGECAHCRKIERGVHPDVMMIAPGDSSAIKIDQIRDAVDRAGYRPFEGRRRVVIVDEADAIVAAAQNALLKTLEEPPASSLFVLVTARPDALLPTVRSRCIRLLFVRGGAHAVDADAREVAHRVLAQVATGPEARRLEAAKELLPRTPGTAAADREQVARHLRAMASLIRDIEAIGARADASLLANGDMRPALERLVPVYQRDRGVAAYASIDRALDAIDRNVGVKVVADWLVLQL